MTKAPEQLLSRRRKLAKKAGIAALGLAVFCAGALWILARESTLVYAAESLMDRLDGKLEMADVKGSLLGTIHVRQIQYEDKFGKVAISDAHMEWRPVRLLMGQIAVGAAGASSVTLDLAKTDEERAKPPQSLRSPISFAVTDFTIDKLAFTKAGKTQEIRGLRAAFSGSRKHLQAELKSLATQYGTVTGEVKLGANNPFALSGNVALTSPDPQDYTLTTTLGGSLLNAEATIEAKARDASAAAQLAVAPYDVQPLTQLRFSAKNFDPHAWAPTSPVAAVSGEGVIVADAQRKLSGNVRFANATPGTLDEKKLPFSQASFNVSGVPELLSFEDVKLFLADAGQFIGRGDWREGNLDMKLATSSFNLHGLQKRLHKTQLAGQLALGGNAATQRVKLALAQHGYQFRFAGALSNGIAQIDEAFAKAGGAQATTHGNVALNAQKNFTLAGRLANFDPSQFGAYPAAKINSRFDFKGQIDPVIQVAANLEVSDSRLFGLPATAKGTIRSRRSDHPEVDINVALSMGETHATAKGTLRDPGQMQSMDLQLTLAGASLDELYKIVGVPLPPTPAYRINGRLLHSGQIWELRHFAGAVGDSDLSGTFVVDRARSPQFMKADLTSKRLDLADLAGFVGAEKTPSGKVTSRSARVLPETPYNLEKLKAADADIHFQGKEVLTEKLPIDDMSAHLIVKGGVLTLAPLNFGVAGGRLVSDVKLDGSGSVIASKADIRVQSLKLERLLPQLKIAKASVGEMDGRVTLAARGNSIAAMLGSANGNTSLVVGEGEVSDLILRLSNLDIANTLMVLVRGDRNIPIRCMVADLAWENGVMRPRQFILDTKHTTLFGEGRADFSEEKLDLRLISKPKGRSLVSLRGPIVVGGTFGHPSVRPDVKQLSARGVAATALAVVATPLAAVIPFVQFGGGKDVQCGPMVQTARHAIEQPQPAVAMVKP